MTETPAPTLTQRWLRQNVAPYPAADRVYADVDAALARLPTLRPKRDVYTYDDGRTQLLVCVHGLLPIAYRGASYNIPVAVWLTTAYPREPPIAYVVPTSDMLVKAGRHVEVSGRCRIEYVRNWERKAEGCSLLALLEAMQHDFSREPPLYAKPRDHQPPSRPPSARPSPVDVSRPPVVPPKPGSSTSAVNGPMHSSPPPSHAPDSYASRPPPPLPSQGGPPQYTGLMSSPPPAGSPPPRTSSSFVGPQSHARDSYASPPPPPPPPHLAQQIPQQISPPPPALAPNTHPHAPPPPQQSYGPSPAPAPAPIRDIMDEEDTSAPPQPPSAGPSSSSSSAAPPPPRPPNPELLRLHRAVHVKLSGELASASSALAMDADRLRAQQADLLAGEPAIRDEMARLEAVRDVCRAVGERLRATVQRAEANVAELRRKGDPEVDELVCSTTIVHNQLINLVAEDNAIEDTIYHLHRALNTGRIDLERFLRTSRVLAEEQFMKRALIEKIEAGLPVGAHAHAQWH